MTGTKNPPLGLVVAAFAAVYVIWGSTYLFIRLVVETMPPLSAAGVRHGAAGVLLYAWTRLRGEPRPAAQHWRSASIIGALLLLGGNGLVMWAEKTVPSGIAALLIATVSLWMILLPAFRPGGAWPRLHELGGVALGFAGVWVLVAPGADSTAPLVGSLMLLVASLSWASGSLYSRRARLPESPLVATAMQMLAGGAILLVVGALIGEWGRADPAGFTVLSLLSLLYLILFGSLVGFTAYMWLLRVSTPAKVSTYAYVNPLVAVTLGSLFLDEPLTPRVFVATALVITAVMLTTIRR